MAQSHQGTVIKFRDNERHWYDSHFLLAEFYETYESVITKTVLCKLYESLITKTCYDHERAQTTTSGHPWTSN